MNTTTAPGAGLPVLVTGASGYIAGWIVRYLLEEGHTVHATVRDPAKQSSVAHLLAMAENAPGTLHLFKADLLDAGSFDAAMAGCGVVMHTASPFIMEGYKDANEALIRPAVEGTRNVLEAVNRTQSVQRVVLTSSIASVVGDNIDLRQIPGGVLTEEHWNATSSADHNPYQFSKVRAEREAWKIRRQQARWDLVTINPSMVYGPALTPGSQSASIDTMVQMGDGRLLMGVPKLVYGVVDVREVARAHLLAAFTPDANGRYILSARELTMMQIGRILRRHFGWRYPFPLVQAPKFAVWAVGPLLGPVTREFVSRNVNHPLRIDNSRSQRELGIHYRPVAETFTEHFQQVIDDGLLRKRRRAG
jgi:nucleoside-diphosphate-sugar epimerase